MAITIPEPGQVAFVRLLTKSRFKVGWECPAKLFYCGRKAEYYNKQLDDDFLQGLAEGGYQVGELARWMLCNDPANDIISTRDGDAALRETARRLQQPDVSVAEAAFRHENLFVRADIVVKKGKFLSLYEVKSKSWDPETDSLWTDRGGRRMRSEWAPYLLDVAFQKHVVEKACPGSTVKAFLVFLDKTKLATVDGLAWKFPVARAGNNIVVNSTVKTKEELGGDLLCCLDADRDIAELRALRDFDLPRGGKGALADLIKELAEIYTSGERCFCGVGAKCRGCEFCFPSDPQLATELRQAGLKSGLDECWGKAVGPGYDPGKPKVIELWNFRQADDAVGQGFFMIEGLPEGFLPADGKNAGRQQLQVSKVKQRDDTPWLDYAGLQAAMASWTFPLHFIDFETSRLALPVRKGERPYSQVAFQFSHHTVDRGGRVTHAGQWIEVVAGKFPSFDFVRALKQNLEKDDGTIFRYAAHENTVLRDIADQLAASSEPDRHELCKWIGTITEYSSEADGKKGKIQGHRNMVDMKNLVVAHHYDPFTHGSNSLKMLLPAIIRQSGWLQQKYNQPISASGATSLNFPGDWVWLKSGGAGGWKDPYKALPPIFEDSEALSRYVAGLTEVDDGGGAIIAYGKLQFVDLPDCERDRIRAALLRYCEMDTLAMVMLYQYWRSELDSH